MPFAITSLAPKPKVSRSPEEVRAIAEELRHAMRNLTEAIPDGPPAPTRISRQLGVNRVLASKLLNAIARENINEMLQQIPGPESLRAMANAAPGLGVGSEIASRAHAAIDAFARMIREDFGTRGALNAAISPQGAQVRQRVELSSRYQVFQGMRELLGVEADTSLTCMIFSPSPEDPEAIATTSIHGALGIRRLRPDIKLHLTFGPPQRAPKHDGELQIAPVDLSDLYTHNPAPVETQLAGGQLVHRLLEDQIGKHASMDMLLVDHDTKGSRRYASAERPRGGGITFPDPPSRSMIFDMLLHDDIFPDVLPQLLVYNPGSRGPANPSDRLRDIDLVTIPESVESLEKATSRFSLVEVPRYAEMIERVCTTYKLKVSSLRLFRLRISYPVNAFQFVLAFQAPNKPASL